MPSIKVLVVRDNGATTPLTPTMLNLMVALLVLFTFGVILIAGLLVLRSVRKSRKRSQLPMYEEERMNCSGNLRSLTITPSGGRRTPSIVVQEKQNLIDHSSSPPSSPIPEIRITFPEEVDDQGKRQSGRVVVVKVGEHTIGLEPLRDDLPPYQQNDGGRFHSLDLDRMGGLKEKEPLQPERRWA